MTSIQCGMKYFSDGNNASEACDAPFPTGGKYSGMTLSLLSHVCVVFKEQPARRKSNKNTGVTAPLVQTIHVEADPPPGPQHSKKLVICMPDQ